MENDLDLFQELSPDVSNEILKCLDDPADIARASLASPRLRDLVIEYGIWKHLCLKLCPQLSGVTRVIDQFSSTEKCAGVACNSSVECEHPKEHRAYISLARAWGLVSSAVYECLWDAMSASSTDNYPDEGIYNTLRSRDRIGLIHSYWSSSGQSDPDVPEWLTYKLMCDFCVISEINIRPYQALASTLQLFFQAGSPIYSAKTVRFRMGYRTVPQKYEYDSRGRESRSSAAKYVWTYTSQEFPMVQENRLQNFKLPQPVLCIGGYLKIELLGRVQKQEIDDLYYICISYVQVMGRSLSPTFEGEELERSGRFALRYNPEASFIYRAPKH